MAKDLTVLFITVEESREEVKEFVEQQKFSEAVIHDPRLNIGKTLGVKSVPTQVLVDGKGVVRYVHSGSKPESLDAFEKQIKALLGVAASK